MQLYLICLRVITQAIIIGVRDLENSPAEHNSLMVTPRKMEIKASKAIIPCGTKVAVTCNHKVKPTDRH